jgi:hypothetical protein
MKDWNLDADALAAAPDIFVVKWMRGERRDVMIRYVVQSDVDPGLFDGVYIMDAGSSFLSRTGIKTGVKTGKFRDAFNIVPRRDGKFAGSWGNT